MYFLVQPNNFNRIAPYYDRIAQLVFGNSIERSQEWLAFQINKGVDVLILGGGTGQILKYIHVPCSVTYLEKSKNMIGFAKRKASGLTIHFVNRDFLEWQTEKRYDLILCPFFLDCFGYPNLRLAIKRCKILLKSEGKLLVADFERKKTSPILSFMMHAFFKISAKLESRALLAINEQVLKSGFSLEKEKFFHQEMIFSRVYGSQ